MSRVTYTSLNSSTQYIPDQDDITHSLVGCSVITLDDVSLRTIRMLLDKARYIDNHRNEVAHTCDGKVLATLFYEPSTRTRLSFETAMIRLGGSVVGFAGAQLSSASKGETVSDTIRVVENYADVVAMRHSYEGAPLAAARAGHIPVVNAGDGGHMHPTQTLADLATIVSRLNRLDHFTIGLCGDLLYGRTVHSLIETLCRFGNVHFVLISPDELQVPQYVIDRINASPSCSYSQNHDLMDVIDTLDILYMTRVQEERFADREQYLRLRDTYILDAQKLSHAQSHMAVLHPLPRVNEISVNVDEDPRAAYFEQVRNGMLMRMALLSSVLGDDLPGYQPSEFVLGEYEEDPAHIHHIDAQAPKDLKCLHARCVTNHESTLPHFFYQDKHDASDYHCLYCDMKIANH